MSPAIAATPAKRDLRTREILLILGLFALVAALRLPGAWSEGRFQDEEATVFLAYGWHFPAEALFRSFGGYLNIAANGITLALAEMIKGGVVSLEKAPYVTMLAGLAAQLVPAILVIRSRSPWLDDLRHRAIALLILVIMPTTEEVFLNVMHIQFHLALSVGLIMALQAGSGRLRAWFEGAILFLAPLCGPAAIVFLPLFALRAVVDRDPRRWRQFAILAAGAAIQLIFFYHSTALRGVPFDPVNLAAGLFIRLLALPLTGLEGSTFFGLVAATGLERSAAYLCLTAFVSVALFSAIFWTTLKARDDGFWLFSAAMSIAVVSLGFGIITGSAASAFFAFAGPRYNYIPLVMIGLCFLCLATRSNPVERRMPRVLLGVMLVVSTVHYFRPLEDYAQGPSWSREVAAWRENPDHRLRVWPGLYSADLSNRAVRCSDALQVEASWSAPRYCQEGWLTSFSTWPGQPKPKP